MGAWKDTFRRWPKWIRVASVLAALGSLALTTFLVLSLIPPRLTLRLEPAAR